MCVCVCKGGKWKGGRRKGKDRRHGEIERARPGDGDGERVEGSREKDTARTVQRKERGVGGGKCTQGHTTWRNTQP